MNQNQPSPRKVLTPCRADYSEVPEMAEYANKIARFCEQIYPKIQQRLSPGSVLSSLVVIFKRNQANPGMTSGFLIYLSSEWFKQHPDDLGAIVHEMTHAVQAYPGGVPSWLTEGIADYMRFWLGYQNSWSYPHCGKESPHYTSGYSCAAAFLRYIERTYKIDIVAQVNARLKVNQYSDSLFQTFTGKTLQQLWQESRQSDCAGGIP